MGVEVRGKGQYKAEMTLSPRLYVKPLKTAITAIVNLILLFVSNFYHLKAENLPLLEPMNWRVVLLLQVRSFDKIYFINISYIFYVDFLKQCILSYDCYDVSMF